MGIFSRIPARMDGFYDRNRMWKPKGTAIAADRLTLVTPSHLLVNIGGPGYAYEIDTELELPLSVASNWDTQSPTHYTVAANRAGKDFYVYACHPASGYAPVFKLSAATTYPAGYNTSTSRKIAAFHCECADVGVISGHPLSGYLAGDILPRSIQDLKHRPKTGFIKGMVWGGITDYDSINYAPIWKAIYMASGTGGSVASIFGATVSVNRDWNSFVSDFGQFGCRMMRDSEFQVLAAGVEEEVNIAGSSSPNTAGGHVSTTGRRMISNIGSEDDTGVWWQWLDEQSYKPPATAGWGWYDLPGAKGSLYNHGGAAGDADVKLLAGGAWGAGSLCGSRCRYADSPRWVANSDFGGRFVAEPQ